MVTIKDIAARAGISIGTVDRILHNRGRFSARTAERVMRIVHELGYTPNPVARQLSRSQTLTIGVVLPDPHQDSGYWELLRSGVRRAERELESFSCRFEYFSFNRYRPGSISALTGPATDAALDALLIAPLRAGEATELIDSFETELPVVFVDTNISGPVQRSYIGQDSHRSGLIAARLLRMLANRDGRGAGRYLVVRPEERNDHLDNRVLGFTEGLESAPNTIRVAIEADHDLERFGATLKSALQSRPAGIFVADASAHYTAALVASEAGDAGNTGRRATTESESAAERPAIVGYDLVPENRRWLEAGFIDALLTQRPAAQGYRAARTLFRTLYFGESCPMETLTPIEIVFKENAQYMTGGWL